MKIVKTEEKVYIRHWLKWYVAADGNNIMRLNVNFREPVLKGVKTYYEELKPKFKKPKKSARVR